MITIELSSEQTKLWTDHGPAGEAYRRQVRAEHTEGHTEVRGACGTTLDAWEGEPMIPPALLQLIHAAATSTVHSKSACTMEQYVSRKLARLFSDAYPHMADIAAAARASGAPRGNNRDVDAVWSVLDRDHGPEITAAMFAAARKEGGE